jgi:hypothetical protein
LFQILISIGAATGGNQEITRAGSAWTMLLPTERTPMHKIHVAAAGAAVAAAGSGEGPAAEAAIMAATTQATLSRVNRTGAIAIRLL